MRRGDGEITRSILGSRVSVSHFLWTYFEVPVVVVAAVAVAVAVVVVVVVVVVVAKSACVSCSRVCRIYRSCTFSRLASMTL